MAKKSAALMNLDSYLLSMNECALIMRMSREKFEKEFIDSGDLPFITRPYGDKISKMVRHGALKQIQNKMEFVNE